MKESQIFTETVFWEYYDQKNFSGSENSHYFFTEISGQYGRFTNMDLPGQLPDLVVFELHKIRIFAPLSFLLDCNARLHFEIGCKIYGVYPCSVRVRSNRNKTGRKNFPYESTISFPVPFRIQPVIPFRFRLDVDNNPVARVLIILDGFKIRPIQ